MSRHLTWDLIRRIRDSGTTVVLVTHFMDEAEALCDRIALIDKKRVVAMDTTEGLIESHANRAEVTFSTDIDDVGFLWHLDEVAELEQQGRRVTVRGSGPLLARVAAELANHGIAPLDLDVRRASLEEVFLTLTEGG